MSNDELAAWVSASCARHGVPVKVTDTAVIARAVTLLSSGAVRPQRGRSPRKGLQPPDGIDAVGVQGRRAGRARPNHSVVQDRCDNGVLPSEVERGPLFA